MYRFVFAIVLLFASSVNAEPTQADVAYGVKHAEERIVQLPQDGNKFYLTVFGGDGSINEWFRTVPELKAFAAQTHFNKYSTQSTEYKERYAKSIGKVPMIRVQTAGGNTLFQVSGDNIPMTGQALARQLNTECLRRWRQNHCQPQPKPEPTPEPEPDQVEPAPDVQPDVAPVEDDVSLGVLLGVAAAGLLAGAGYSAVALMKQRNAAIR